MHDLEAVRDPFDAAEQFGVRLRNEEAGEMEATPAS